MTLRKGLLWLMLASLGLSAVGGALAVLTAGTDIVWRVAGTGLATAVGAGLLLSLSLLLDKEKSRPAGLLGMGAVVAAFILTLALIWAGGTGLMSGGRDEWNFALTLLALLLAAPPAMLFLRLTSTEPGKWAGIIGVATCAVAFAAMLVGSWWNLGSSSGASGNLWVSAGIIGAFGVLAAASLAGWGTDRRYWRWGGVLMSAAGGAMGLIGLWANLHQGGVAFVVVAGLAVVVGHANLALMCPLKTGQQWVRVVTIAAVAMTAVLLGASAWAGVNMEWEAANRGAGAAGVVAACGSLALLILARLNRRMASPTVPPSVKELLIVCPWCQRRQNVPLGDSSCGGCGLRFKIAVEEPRCATCDYLLYMLHSDRCPECGTPIGTRAATA